MDATKFIPNPEDVSVTWVEIWRDGGTVSVIFTDSSGQEFPCCFGGALNKDAGRLYIGAVHPQDGPVHLVPLGSNIQQDVINALKRHLNQQFTPSELDTLSNLDGSRGFIHGTITEQEHKGYLLIYCIKRLEALTQGA